MHGFTLMELMIVIGLIMILSVVGIGSFTASTVKSKDSQRKGNLNQISKALEVFYTDVGRYPLSETLTDTEDQKNTIHCYEKVGVVVTNTICSGSRLYSVIDGVMTTYITVPTDPDPAQKYPYVSIDGTSFSLYASLENLNDRDILHDLDGNLVTYPSVSCGSTVSCNYKVVETGLVKDL